MGPKSKDWWTEEETGGTRPQAQGHPELLDAVGGRKDPPLQPPEGAWPWDTLTLEHWPLEP